MSQAYPFGSPYGSYVMNQGQPRPAMLPPNAQSFVGFIQDGKILQSAPDGPQPVGVTMKLHDDLQEQFDCLQARTQEYYDALVDAGVIVPDPTPDEIIQRQAEQLKEAAETISEARQMISQGQEAQFQTLTLMQQMAAEIKELKNAGGKHELSQHPEEPARTLAAVEEPDRPGLEAGKRVPGQPRRSEAGHSGERAKAGRPRKSDGTFAKRAGG